jgi:transcriptional regulator NrdR family protein
MKCPDCKAWTEVKETRKRLDGTTYRRYECANLHRFTTREGIVSSPKAKQ